MRTLVRWIVVTLGIAALVRWLRHRGETQARPQAQALEDPAEELRRKLEESRATGQEAKPAPESSVEDRRSDVHAQGRAALAEMTPPDES